jgi:hypothetical protein
MGKRKNAEIAILDVLKQHEGGPIRDFDLLRTANQELPAEPAELTFFQRLGKLAGRGVQLQTHSTEHLYLSLYELECREAVGANKQRPKSDIISRTLARLGAKGLIKVDLVKRNDKPGCERLIRLLPDQEISLQDS